MIDPPRRLARHRLRLRLLGLFCVLLFWMPLIAPLLQLWTLADALRAAWRGSVDRLSVAIGTIGAVGGFVLFLLATYVWIV
jgi:hypothetical protein